MICELSSPGILEWCRWENEGWMQRVESPLHGYDVLFVGCQVCVEFCGHILVLTVYLLWPSKTVRWTTIGRRMHLGQSVDGDFCSKDWHRRTVTTISPAGWKGIQQLDHAFVTWRVDAIPCGHAAIGRNYPFRVAFKMLFSTAQRCVARLRSGLTGYGIGQAIRFGCVNSD